MTQFVYPMQLSNEKVKLQLLVENDFESLYQVASDPLIWEQHPNKERYKREVFIKFFEGALASKSAFLVKDQVSGDIIGCSRFYDFDEVHNSICIGYTFLARKVWGKSYNRSLKKLMLDYAFNYVESVIFHVGDQNIRSQKAMDKLGAVKWGEAEMSYYGEAPHNNFFYRIDKDQWEK